MKNILLSVDGTNTMHRAYHAVRPLSYKGTPTNVISGFFSILLKALRDTKATHCAVTFDVPGTNFRHDIFPEYKGQRIKDPEKSAALRIQAPILARLLSYAGIAVIGKGNIEGDDIIGGIAFNHDGPSYILSTDKDFGQLLTNKQLSLLNPHKGIITYKNCKDIYGVKPKQIIDYLMLEGDEIDNIPKVRGIGKTTAIKLLSEFKRAEDIPIERMPKAGRETVKNMGKFLKRNRKLVTIQTDLYDPSHLDLSISNTDVKRFSKLCDKYGLAETKRRVLDFM